MYCNKCGNEIKEGNTFCTNCGTSVNKVQKNSKLKEYKIPIIIIIIWIVIMCIIVGIKAVSNRNQYNKDISTNNEIVENITNDISNQENEIDVEDNTDDTRNLLDEIYAKYPEMEGEGIICYNDYGEYWLLDNEGKKVYFSSLETFESALEKCNEGSNSTSENIDENNASNDISTTTSNSNKQNISNDNSEDKQTSNSNNQNTNNNEENNTIKINDINTNGMTYSQIKAKLESRGLQVKVNELIENVPYIDEKAGTEECTIYDTSTAYQVGDTVMISKTIYKGQPVNVEFYIRIENITADKGIYCVLNKDNIEEDCRNEGVQVYFDNKLVATPRTEGSSIIGFEYQFTKEKNVKVKIVSPYAYGELKSENVGMPIQQNVIIKEFELKIEDITSQMWGYSTSYGYYLY